MASKIFSSPCGRDGVPPPSEFSARLAEDGSPYRFCNVANVEELPVTNVANFQLAIGIGYWHHWQHSHRAVTRRRKKRAGVAVAGIVVWPEGSRG